MKCSKCGAWSRVLDTRTTEDGYVINRRHRCANDHVFRSVQVFATGLSQSKRRVRETIEAAKRRAALEARKRLVLRRLADGEIGRRIADDLGVSESLVSLIKRGKI